MKIMIILMSLIPAALITLKIIDMQKQLDHLNAVTFESSRCPDSLLIARS